MAQQEFELITTDRIRHVKVFVNDITYRNYHYHDAFEIMLVLSGAGELRMHSEVIHLKPGNLVLVNPNEPHEIDTQGGHVTAIILQVSRHFGQEYLTDLRHRRFLQQNLTEEISDPNRLKVLATQICTLSKAYLQERPYFAYECIAGITALFHSLLSTIPNSRLSDQDRSQIRDKVQRMNRILDYIEQHYAEPIRLKDLASLEGLTPTYVSHFFSEQFGVSFQTYLNNMRFERAIALLSDSSVTATDVTFASGFSDPKYLNQMMRRRMGCSIREFRQGLSIPTQQSGAAECSHILERYLAKEEAIDAIEQFRANHTYCVT